VARIEIKEERIDAQENTAGGDVEIIRVEVVVVKDDDNWQTKDNNNNIRSIHYKGQQRNWQTTEKATARNQKL